MLETVDLLTDSQPVSNSDNGYLTEEYKNWDRLLARENKIVEYIKTLDHLDPREHDNHKESLCVDDDRMFIKGFLHVPRSQLVNSNVRDNEVDEKYAKEVLLYHVEEYAEIAPKSLGLKYPVFGVQSIVNGDITTQSGHHRAFVCDYRETLVPVLLITKPINRYGKKTDPNADNLAKARCNPGVESKPMTLSSGVLHLQKLFSTDPTLDGRNPTGEMIPRKSTDGRFDFNGFCEHAFKRSRNFKSPQARGKLYNKWTKQGHKSKTEQTSDENNITLFLSRNGLSTGIDRATGKRKDVTRHADLDSHALIVQTDDNGDNFGGKLWRILREFSRDKLWAEALASQGITKVIVAGRLYNTPNTLKEVRERRKKFYKIAQDYNKILAKTTPLYIEKVVMPKELKLVKDKDEEYIISQPPKTILRKM